MKKIILTGGAGFIGSAFIRTLLKNSNVELLTIDKLTYAGDLSRLITVQTSSNYHFVKADIADAAAIQTVIAAFKPMAVLNLAAESHVDRSIDSPENFIQSNIAGTYTLLQAALNYWKDLSKSQQEDFRFHHISTDEVYGSLGSTGKFTELTPYDPRSPYSSSKAASDHLVMAWHHTYGLPVLLTNCSNNYGPYQFPEKLIPLAILNALAGKPITIYGDGKNIRDWLYVDDHVEALLSVIKHGRVGERYNIGGNNERTNLEVVTAICDLLDELRPRESGMSYANLIEFVEDRPGHDQRYAIDASKIRDELGWAPKENFESGLRKTVVWYLENESWWEPIVRKQSLGQRLGLGEK